MASFHAFEQTNTKQGMARVSIIPFGAKWRFDGLGFPGFYDYGYGNVTADSGSGNNGPLPSPLFNATKAHLSRLAGLIHYDSEWWGLAFEYDQGHNALTYREPSVFPGVNAVAHRQVCANNTLASSPPRLLNNGRAVEQGYDAVLGHLHIPETPLTLFGMFEWWPPNTHVDENPFDFQRWVAGVSYQYNEFLRISLSIPRTVSCTTTTTSRSRKPWRISSHRGSSDAGR